MPVAPSIVNIKVNGTPIDRALLLTMQTLEVELGVHAQGVFRFRTIMGQDPQGDWAGFAERSFTPGSVVSVDVRMGTNQRNLIRGYITEFKMDFNADPCTSTLEIVGMDALEKLKRREGRRNMANKTLQAAVTEIFNDSGIQPPTSGVPNTGAASPNGQPPMQAQNDLEFIRRLADENDCEVYVEPSNGTDQGFFKPLSLSDAPEIPTAIVIQQGTVNHVRNASFYYDLSGATAVIGNFVDANGRALGDPVRVDLRDTLSSFDKTLLGPPDFAKVERLQRSGSETRDHLQSRCAAKLEKTSWVVVGKGELDTQTYGDLLFPRHRVKVQGAARSFGGDYLVWKVTHKLTREQHCQSFELRRKLGVN